MQVIKSNNCEIDNLELLITKIQELENKMICDTCPVKNKDLGLCTLETECEFYAN